jgi:hypothetical protein
MWTIELFLCKKVLSGRIQINSLEKNIPGSSLHCPRKKADFRENKGGSPLEGNFSSNPWK